MPRLSRPLPLLLALPVLALAAGGSAIAVVAAGAVAAAHADEAVAAQVDLRRVRGILSDKCFKCHGPDANARRAGLRLDRPHEAAEVSSRADGEAPLLQRIESTDPRVRMPPPESKLRLTDEEAALLRQWVEQGAPPLEHWSFVPPVRPPLPEVRSAGWASDPLDRFVLARLEREGIEPRPPADRELWLRRASFRLIGLPPDLDELDRYLADGDAGAEERAVDRLLARPEYGERMAADWLDVARYSDTYGYQVDRERFVWPWRDWVVRAFQENLPYDRFLTWQLAGDLVDEPCRDSVLATTFQRLHPQKVEGGSVPEEFRVEYTADRLHTAATAFLGLTMECARCHDHKYDSLPQRDYYRMFAFFNNIDEAGLYSYFTPSIPTPTATLEDEATAQRLAEAREALHRLEQESARRDAEDREAFETWLRSRPAFELPAAVAHLDFEGAPGGENRSVEGKVGKAFELSGDDGVDVGAGNFRRWQPFSVSLWMRTPDPKERAVVWHRSRAWTDAGSRGYQLLLEDGRLSFSMIHFWPGNALRVRAREALAIGCWTSVTVTHDGSGRADGVRIFVDGLPQECEVVRDGLRKHITGGGGDNLRIGERFRDKGFTGGRVDEFRVFDRQLSALEVDALAGGARAEALLTEAAAASTPGFEALLREHHRLAHDEAAAARRAALGEARRQVCELEDGLEEIMVMRELSPRRPTFVLQRGAYDAPGEAVEPGTPEALPAMEPGDPPDRLGLARWMTRPGHPLTARVAVNRLWQLCFGDGLVRTPEDFGSQGDAPTHPEMLDWLALDLVDSGWDVKAMMKRLVLSSTFRQDSRSTPTLRERDPANRLLARAPRMRLPAEMLRDQALEVSGLLVHRVGGPPVRPYDLAESFKPMNPDQGEGLYRRSLYTYWKRTGPSPAMMALDAAKRDVCMVKRERTHSPLQALVLLNAPQFVEAARQLGQRALLRHPDDPAAMVAEVFRRATSRPPDPEEVSILTALYQDQLAAFEARPEDAAASLKVGNTAADASLPVTRLAAAAVLAQAVLNYDAAVVLR